MIFAKAKDFDKVYTIFKQHRKWFPHVRSDHLKVQIDRKQIILEDGVVIVFHHAKRKQKIGDVQIVKGDTVLHQIASDSPGSGNAQSILNDFFEYCSGDVFLSVRADNLTANKFYVKMNMNLIGKTSWSKGTIPGNVYVKRKRSNKELETK